MPTRPKVHLCGTEYKQLEQLVDDLGEKSFRAKQLADWIWGVGLYDFDEMTNLSKRFRIALSEHSEIFKSTIVRRHDASDKVVKLLLELADGEHVETVIIPAGLRINPSPRRTVCISTQVGCPMGCKFCASGADGFVRNLQAGEIVEQVMQCRATLAADHAELTREEAPLITNVVLMGMGEPLANYEESVKAMRILNDARLGSISARRITLSTVGLSDGIRRLAGESLPVNLAISLHATSDQLRRQLIPAAHQNSIAEILQAAGEYFDNTGREITLEYTLMAGVNDSPQQARELAAITRQVRSNVNLIRYNPTDALAFRRPTEDAVAVFRDTLISNGVNVHIRPSRGVDVSAACGQLRKNSAASP